MGMLNVGVALVHTSCTCGHETNKKRCRQRLRTKRNHACGQVSPRHPLESEKPVIGVNRCVGEEVTRSECRMWIQLMHRSETRGGVHAVILPLANVQSIGCALEAEHENKIGRQVLGHSVARGAHTMCQPVEVSKNTTTACLRGLAARPPRLPPKPAERTAVTADN